MKNLVAIVGRPNVGKSTLFNRLIGERKAIIDNVSGVTRDRTYGTSFWNGKNFSVIDTGGFVHGSDDIFEAAIREQVDIAIEEANVIIFMVDVSTGITDLDDEIANKLRKTEKPVVLVVNKVDNSSKMLEANEFWSLGFESTYFVASISGSGTGELLDEIVEHMQEEEEEDSDIPKIAIVGQPNVGKSSITNVLLGEDRAIVTDIAGTTRDSINTRFNKFGRVFDLIDTAGMRKKAKVHENLEFYSVMRAIRAIDEADVCILMIDAQDGIETQDMNIFSLIYKRKKGVIILVNKWDLIEKETNTARDFKQKIMDRIAPFNDVPILFVSALEKQRVLKAVDIALEVYKNRTQKITTSKLNDLMLDVIDSYPPPSYRGKYIKIKYVTQLGTKYPAFGFFCNYPQHVKESYKNFLENKLRETYNFQGVPIGIVMKKK